MKPTNWKILAILDAGVDAGRVLRVAPEDPNGWLSQLAPEVTLQLGQAGARRTHTVKLDGAEAFDPASIARRLMEAGGGGDDPTGGPPSPAGLLDGILQDPNFRRVESAWRGLRLLAKHAGGPVELEVLSTPRAALAERFETLVHDPVLEGREDPPALVVLDFDFTHSSNDFPLLQRLAELAAALPCPIVAAAAPGLFGMRYWAHVAGIGELSTPWMDAGHSAWREFQASEPARWAALTMNRYLQRAPHELADLGWRETVDEARPETFLWGRGSWLVGAAVARSVREHGHALDIAGRGGMFDGLPTRAYPHTGEPVALAAEAPLPEMKASEIAWAGLTPIVGVLRRDAVLMPMVVTLFRLQPGRLTLEGTLAYQVTAARVASALNELLPRIPADREAAPHAVRSELAEALAPILGPTPIDAVTASWTEPASGAPSLLEIHIRPPMPFEGKEAEFVYHLPARG